MSKATASKERDAMKAQLAAMMSSTKAPGTEQAERAVQKKDKTKAKAQPKPRSKSIKKVTKTDAKKVKASTKPKVKAKSETKPISRSSIELQGREAGEERAETVSVSLHPTDQDNAELIEDALRAAGLINRRAPISFLIKVALASFDSEKMDNLEEVVASIKSRDGRGKWMKGMSKKE